jgi:hypothetical protein
MPNLENEFFLDFEDVANASDSAGNTLSDLQYQFFKNSKCVDEYGDLYLVYRASNHDYDTFDPARMGTGAGSIFGKGIYFSADRDSVKIYGNNIKAYYLNLKNPFRYEEVNTEDDAVLNVERFVRVLEQNNFFVTEDLWITLEEEILDNDGGLDTLIELTCGPEKATDFFKKCGFDGIMNLDVLDFVAYYPNQIKISANKAPTSAISTVA